MELISFTITKKYPKYEGQFNLRYPSLADLEAIGLRHITALQRYGNVAPDKIGKEVKIINYVFTAFEVLKEEKLPEWFNKEKLTNIDVMYEAYDIFLKKVEEVKKNSMNG